MTRSISPCVFASVYQLLVVSIVFPEKNGVLAKGNAGRSYVLDVVSEDSCAHNMVVELAFYLPGIAVIDRSARGELDVFHFDNDLQTFSSECVLESERVGGMPRRYWCAITPVEIPAASKANYFDDRFVIMLVSLPVMV